MRQRLAGVATVAISESAQTTEVVFAPGDHPFSLDDFRSAIGQAKVEVVTVDIEACGVVQAEGGQRWFRTGQGQYLLENRDDAPEGRPVCISGRVDDSEGPPRLTVTALEPQQAR